ncbi:MULTISPECIES: hypothetical protein [unclassified Streptomyces]|uniref:hypothetical protein n=1 Tax=unclassified Streptomyces TaxID=2593676 RepID=UPI0033A00DB0
MRFQEYKYEVGVGDHVPCAAVSLWPTLAVPLGEGALVAFREGPTATVTADDVELTEPAPLVTVALHEILWV